MADININVSDLRTRITFQEETVTKDDGGAQVAGYADIETNPTVWARWINAHGNEVTTSEALKSVQRATVTVRNRSDILITWRILRDSEVWQIISIDSIHDRNRWVEMIVERVKGTV